MPDRIAHYELLQALGSGPLGTTYRARNIRTGTLVAVKILDGDAVRRDSVVLARILHAARIAGQLDHPNISRVIDYGQDGERNYVVAELVEGESLRDRLRREHRLSEVETHGIARNVAHALNAADAHRVVHGDLTPGNVLLGEGDQVRVCDFNLTQAMNATTLTHVVAFIASPAYTAPEVDVRRPDIRSDLYALGVIMFEVLTGRVPFDGDSPAAIMRRHETEPPDFALLRRAGRRLAPVVQRLLEKDPSERYANPDHLLEALSSVGRLDSNPVSDRRLAPRTQRGAARLLTTAGSRIRLRDRLRSSTKRVRRVSWLVVRALAGVGSLVVALVGLAGHAAVRGFAGLAAVLSRAWRLPRTAKLASAGLIGAVAIAGGGFLAVQAMDGGDGGANDGSLASGPRQPRTPVGTNTPPHTRTPRPQARTAPLLPATATPGPPTGVIAGVVSTPQPAQPRSGASPREPAPSSSAPTPLPPSPVPAGSPAGTTPTLVPTIAQATPPTPSLTPRPSTATFTPTPLPPTGTVTPAPVSISFLSDSTWSVYWDEDLTDYLGSAQIVCLRRAPVAIPADCPSDAESWEKPGSGGWSAALSPAQWIWAPGITKDTWNPDYNRFFFEQCIDLPGTPIDGLVEIAADRYADIIVNDQLVREISGAGAPKTVDITPYLAPGLNCITFAAENDAVCPSGCTYQENPAGLLFRGTLTYLPG